MQLCALQVADFGLCKLLDDGQGGTLGSTRERGPHQTVPCVGESGANTCCGTLRYMAPEVVRREVYGPAADVYGFALVLFELITREVPFDGWSAERVSALVALRGRRPQLPINTPAQIDTLIQCCWQDTPTERPTFVAIQSRLAQIRASLEPRELEWLGEPEGHKAPPMEGARGSMSRSDSQRELVELAVT